MKLLRNTEVRNGLLIHIAITLLATGGAWWLDWRFGLFTALLCAVFTVLHLCITKRRYDRLAALAGEIDNVLHGEQALSLDRYAEGELAILHSEIYKMTVRLREQQQRLLDDKIYLADSIADISHQLRTPLTSINLLLELLSDPAISAARHQELTRELYDLLSRIDWLIITLLKLSKLDAGTVQFKKETLPLEALLRQAASPLLIPMELRQQELSLVAEGTFSGDAAWTCEALGNILKNCMEHTPTGGCLTVTASENTLYTEILIADNGHGIDKDDLPHIFERFYKGKHADSKSFGIGLALAHRIITGQQGTVKAENGVDGGAVFTIRFYKGIV